MNILFVGIRGNDESEITSAPIKIANCLYNRLSKKDGINLFFYDFINKETNEMKNQNEYYGSIFKIGKVIKEKNIDVVYLTGFYTLPAFYLSSIKLIYNFKLVYTIHGLAKKEKEINKTFKFYNVIAEKILLKSSNEVISITEEGKNELIKYYPTIKHDKIEIINNGVKLENIKEYVDIKKVYALRENMNLIFTIGTRKIKNIEVILKNFIDSKEIYDSSYLLIAGELDTEYSRKLCYLYKGYDNIKFIGQVDVNLINNIFNQVDLFIQISEFETFGVSIVEALLHKKQVIISKNLPIARYFDSNEVHFYDKSDDLKSIINNTLSDKNDNCLGFNKANKIFNWDNISEKYYNAFMKLNC